MNLAELNPTRRETLRNGLLTNLEHLRRRQACAIPEADIDDYVALEWFAWHGGGLKLTELGENVRRQLVSKL